MWAKGVPPMVLTSLHSADERLNNDKNYNRLISSLDGLSQKWKLGLGVNVPFGLKTDWGRTWIGRYHATKSELVTININPDSIYTGALGGAEFARRAAEGRVEGVEA